MGRNHKKRKITRKTKVVDSGIKIKEVVQNAITSKKVEEKIEKKINYSIDAKIGKVVADNLIKRPPRFECGL